MRFLIGLVPLRRYLGIVRYASFAGERPAQGAVVVNPVAEHPGGELADRAPGGGALIVSGLIYCPRLPDSAVRLTPLPPEVAALSVA